jgi:hypothetical protein
MLADEGELHGVMHLHWLMQVRCVSQAYAVPCGAMTMGWLMWVGHMQSCIWAGPCVVISKGFETRTGFSKGHYG